MEQNNGEGELNTSQIEKIVQLQDLTGIEDTEVCKALLQSNDWDLESTAREQLGIPGEDNPLDIPPQPQQHQHSALSGGALVKMCSGEKVDSPKMQILGLRKLAGSDRYRILLSDGVSSRFCMLSTDLNPRINEFEKFTVIKLEKYIANQVLGHEKRVIILTEVSVEKAGSEVREMIGDPQAMETPKAGGGGPVAGKSKEDEEEQSKKRKAEQEEEKIRRVRAKQELEAERRLPKKPKYCKIRFRQRRGPEISETFRSDEPLDTLYAWVRSNQTEGQGEEFDLYDYGRRGRFTPQDRNKSLQSLNLPPQSLLLILAKTV